MQGRSCTIVLVGANTAGRKWINYEIIESWNQKMGVVGIHIHGLKDKYGHTSAMGHNPFASVVFPETQMPLSNVVRCYDPPGWDSTDRYNWIASNLSGMVEEAIAIRNQY